MNASRHIPVLLDEVIAALAPRADGIYVDATFGAGGYSQALLTRAQCSVIGIDRDPDAITDAAPLAARFEGRLTLVQGRFGDMERLIARPVDGIAFDLGVSSMQIDEAMRGFSFRFDGPLDMRMSGEGPSAADLVNTASEGELADIIHLYGEERHARRIAREIVRRRSETPLNTTAQLADAVRRVVPKSGQSIDPATRTFQALRIAVNDELGELENGLKAAENLLRPGGRLAVVTFHSLEDRRVKEFLKRRSGDVPAPSRHLPGPAQDRKPSFKVLTKRPVEPSEAELARNPRARSAKLRAAERTEAPAWGQAA